MYEKKTIPSVAVVYQILSFNFHCKRSSHCKFGKSEVVCKLGICHVAILSFNLQRDKAQAVETKE